MDRADNTMGLGDARATLDLNAEEFRALGYELVDRISEFIASLPERSAAPNASPAQVRELLGQGSLPESKEEPRKLLNEAADLLFDYTRLNGHPRSWGYIIGSPAPIGMLGDFLASAVNPNVVAWNGSPMATEIEAQVVRWIAEFLGYPTDCGGLLVSGGNMANFVGFLTARHARSQWNVRAQGLSAEDSRRLRVYVSQETHTWIEKAADLFGLGTDAIRWIPTDSAYRMHTGKLTSQIEEDLSKGDLPFLIVGTAGTVSTGAVDPLVELAAIARENNMWFHVDGAYGAVAVAVPSTPADLKGLREADSIAIDAHKWLFAPLEAGCAIVRNPKQLRDTFSYSPSYYRYYGHPGEEPVNFHEYGPQNSRGFRALKVWLALRQAGRQNYVDMISNNIQLAQTLYRDLEATPDFEVGTQGLSVTTFRYVPNDLEVNTPKTESYLNELNGELLSRIQKGGEAYASNAVLDGKFFLRVCVTNFRSTLEDVRALPAIVRRLGSNLDHEMRPRDLRLRTK